MRYLIGLFLFFLALNVQGQNFERKVIIQDGKYYYVSVDENLQIGTLYIGLTKDDLKLARAYALPAGRGISAQINPLAWDINKDEMTAINFMDHSLNDRNEAIKKIAIKDLKEWGPAIQVEELVMLSIDQPMLALNEPYIFIRNRSIYSNHFYFDGIMLGDEYWMVITNNDELMVWQYKSNVWSHSDVIKFPVSGAFSLFKNRNDICMITNDGSIFKMGLSGMKNEMIASTERNLEEVILIDDRDNDRTYTIKRSAINFDTSIVELIKKSAKLLTLN